MNHISIIGNICEEAKLTLVKTAVCERPLVVFRIEDKGLPYQKTEPMYLDVYFMKEAAPHIYQYLKKDKEVLVFGYLKKEKRTNKIYLSAEYVQFTGKKEPVYED